MAKQRLSFVTNSSSSGFVLAVKDEGFLNSGTSKLEKFVKGIIFGNAKIIKTKEELDEYCSELWLYPDITLEEYLKGEYNKYEREKYQEYLQYINNGYLIVEREIGNNDDAMIDLINEMPDGENIIMIGCDY